MASQRHVSHIITYSGQSVVRQPGRGRPCIEINIDEVEFLRALHLPWNKIVGLLGISRHTLYCRLTEEGILRELQFTEIPNEDLDDLIKDIKGEHPNDGEVLVTGHLLAKGIRVPCAQIRPSIHRVDPDNTVLQRRRAVVRRV